MYFFSDKVEINNEIDQQCFFTVISSEALLERDWLRQIFDFLFVSPGKFVARKYQIRASLRGHGDLNLGRGTL